MFVTTSYKATVSAMNEISKHYMIPIASWIREGVQFKFVGVNVDKEKGMGDLRADRHGKIRHMFSLIS